MWGFYSKVAMIDSYNDRHHILSVMVLKFFEGVGMILKMGFW